MLPRMNNTAPVALAVTVDRLRPCGSKALHSYTFHGVWSDNTLRIERVTLWQGAHVCTLESEAELARIAGHFMDGRKRMTAARLRTLMCEASEGFVSTVAPVEG